MIPTSMISVEGVVIFAGSSAPQEVRNSTHEIEVCRVFFCIAIARHVCAAVTAPHQTTCSRHLVIAITS